MPLDSDFAFIFNALRGDNWHTAAGYTILAQFGWAGLHRVPPGIGVNGQT
jgi:hypothetical protein